VERLVRLLLSVAIAILGKRARNNAKFAHRPDLAVESYLLLVETGSRNDE